MTASIPTCEPTTFAAGETVAWTKAVPDYPNTDGWSLVYSIRGLSAFPDVTATNVSDGTYSVLIAADSTGPLAPGTYQWASHAYKAGPPVLRYPVERGVIVVTPNLVTTSTIESHAAKTLRMIEAVIEGRVTADVQDYQIAGRQVTKIDITELYRLRAFYRTEVWKERNPNRANPTRAIAFVSPS